ncbi:NAD(P)-binding protein, partial [Calocera cornea HHB12733]
EALAANGASLVIVDYTAPSSLQPALQGIDVLICTFGVTALAVQAPLAEAAKLVGVQLSIPSEFGGNTAGKSEGPLAHKNAHLAQVQQIGIPWTVFYTGPFADWVWRLGFDIINGKVEVGGTGNGLVSWTSRSDIARYVAHTLTALTKEKLHNRVLKLEGQRISINGVLAAYQERTGKKLEVTYIPLEEVRERARDKGDVKAWLQLVWEEEGTYGAEGEMNVDWPEFGPQGVVNAILDSWP